MLQELSPWDGGGWLAKGLEGSAVSLQQVLQGVLTQWRGLSFAVRPRLLWVVAHYLELPNMLEVSTEIHVILDPSQVKPWGWEHT
jgi:hypothetical protein